MIYQTNLCFKRPKKINVERDNCEKLIADYKCYIAVIFMQQ